LTISSMRSRTASVEHDLGGRELGLELLQGPRADDRRGHGAGLVGGLRELPDDVELALVLGR
jgi:hypothetical protein